MVMGEDGALAAQVLQIREQVLETLRVLLAYCMRKAGVIIHEHVITCMCTGCYERTCPFPSAVLVGSPGELQLDGGECHGVKQCDAVDRLEVGC